MRAQDLPDFKDLPAVKGMPHGCAWGLFDKDGKRDNVGTLNLLIPEVVMEAKKEIQIGVSVALNWPLHKVHHPAFMRKEPEHKFLDLNYLGFIAYDDEIHINTQSGSQWDGFKHCGHQETELYYNGLKHGDVIGSMDNGIHHWSKRGGIVGRGVLLDYASWAEKKGIQYNPMSRHQIFVKDLDEIANDQGVELRPGDILIVRSGWIKWYDAATPEDRYKHVAQGQEHIGVDGNAETVEWLWNHHFSAIAGDAIAWESWPPKAPYSIHDFSLALWGEPIGELWDLEELSELCKKHKRWSFFLTSAPLNIEGGVASPANALALF